MENNQKTIEELINESDSGSLKEQLSGVIKTIEKQEGDKLNGFLETLKGIVDSNKATAEAMKNIASDIKRIADRPDPEFPEPKDFPELQKVHMDRPDWQKDAEPINHDAIGNAVAKLLVPLLEELIERTGNEHSATRAVLVDLLNKEPEIPEAPKGKKEKVTVGGGVGSIRRRARWEIATFPQLPGTMAITTKGDGTTFYLPFAPIKNSETIRLNGGLPMSNGIDYNLNGNRLTFIQNQTGSQIEMRAQN